VANLISVPAGYSELLQDLRTRIRSAQVRAALAVNRELVLLYWSIGKDILARQGMEGWGGRVIDQLAHDLQNEFPGVEGFSPRSLKYMHLTDIPNVRQRVTRLGNWLTREQAKELLAVPDRSKLKGKRDYVIIALLVGCALRRRELATLNIEDIQLREGRWVIIDLRGKGGRIRTVAVPIWVKQGINAWMAAAQIEAGRLLRPVSKSGKILREELGDWAIWSVVEQSSKQIGIEHFGAHDLRRTCAKLCRKSSCLGIRRSRPPNAIWGRSRISRSR
jgi:integrase